MRGFLKVRHCKWTEKIIFFCVMKKLFWFVFFWNRAWFGVMSRLFFVLEVINSCMKRVTLRWLNVPLTEAVEFKAVLQKGNRFQLPRLIRWKFKLETDQVLKVTVFPAKSFTGECFYAKMDKSGRVAMPSLTRKLLETSTRDNQNLIGSVLEIRLQPA